MLHYTLLLVHGYAIALRRYIYTVSDLLYICSNVVFDHSVECWFISRLQVVLDVVSAIQAKRAPKPGFFSSTGEFHSQVKARLANHCTDT